MSTASILHFFREQEPRFRDEPDEKLINFIGSTKKAFLQDEEFKQDFQNVLRGQMQTLQTPEGRQQVASQAGVEDLSTTQKAVSSLQAGSRMLASNLALAGSRTIDRARRTSFGGFLSQVPGLGDLISGAVETPEEVVAKPMAESAQQIREVRDILPATKLQSVVNIVAEAAPSIGPALVAGPIGGLAATVGAAAVTSYGAVLSDAEQELRDRGYSESEVRQNAHAEATVAGLSTALITGGFNKFAPGLEKLAAKAFRDPNTVVTTGGQTVGQFKRFVTDTLKGFGSEASEEALDETAQSLLEMYVRNPNMSATEVVKRAGVAGLAGGILGAGAGAAMSVTTTPQTDQALKEGGPRPEDLTTPTQPLEAPLAEPVVEESERITGTRSVEEIAETAPPEPSVFEQAPVTEEAPVAEEAPVFQVTEQMTPEQRQSTETANALTEEARGLATQVDALNQQIESLEATFPSAKETPASMRDYTSRLKSQRRALELKQEQLEVKRMEALEEASKVVEDSVIDAVESEPPNPFQTDPIAERAGLFVLGAVHPSLRPFLNYTGEKLKLGVDSLFRFGDRFRQKLFGGKGSDIANLVTNFIRTQASGLRNSADTLVKAFEANLSKVFVDAKGKRLPVEQRNIAPLDELLRSKDAIKNVDFDKFSKRLFAHRGENYVLTENDKQLARDVIENLDQARKMIDYLSKAMVDSGIVADDAKATFEDAIGEYLTRSYKVFNKAYGWNWDTIPTAIRDAAVKDIMSSVNKKRPNDPITEQEAIEIAREMTTDRDSAFEWSIGLSAIRGVPVRLLYKRKQLSKPIRELLGEIKDPVTNTLLTLDKQINLLMGFQQQNQIAELMVESGIASHEEDKSKGFTQQIFQDNFALGIQSKQKYPSLRPLYTTPGYAKELQSFFSKYNGAETLRWFKRALKKLAGITKFNLVILNPAAYSTQYVAAAANEIKQGRLLWPNYSAGVGFLDAATINAKAATMLLRNRKLRKEGKNLPSLQDQDDLLKLKGSDFLKKPSQFISENSLLLEDVAYRFGALSDNVDLRYLEDLLVNQRESDVLKDLTAKRMWEDLGKRLNKETLKALGPLKGLKSTRDALTKIYGGGDAAGKMNAFLVETIGEASSNPDATLEDIMTVAAQKTMATTPTPATIAPSIREASAISLLNTFISWQIELVRNTYNQAAIAAKEIQSTNPVTQARGYRRSVSGIAMIASAVAAGRTMLEALMGLMGSNDEEYTPEAGDWIAKNLLPPWDENQSTAIVRFNKKGFAYNPLSYVMPDAILGIPFKAAMKGESWNDSVVKVAESLKDTVGGLHPLVQAFQILIQNYDPSRGIKVANTELPLGDQLAKRAWEAGLTVSPGIAKTLLKKLPRILSDGKKPFGREYTVEEELMSYMGIRTYGYEWEGALRGQMQNFERRIREAKRIVPTSDLDELRAQGKTEEAEALEKKENDRVQAIANEYAELYVGALRHVPGLTKRQLNEWQSNIYGTVGGTRLAKELRQAATAAANAAGY